jgi:CheY-like chemotaxis protein
MAHKMIKHILIVDDDEDDRYILNEVLSEIDSSLQCTNLNNGVEAIDHLNQHIQELPDLVFLDLNMPVMDGKQFLKEIILQPRLKEVPIVIYSTSKNPGDEEETKILGAFYYLVKPVDFNALKAEVKNIILKAEKSASTFQ